jgi:tripartite-type tricarboxylate transporter receptor subunit TctC
MIRFTRRSLLTGLIGLASAAAFAGTAEIAGAQDWPTAPVHIIAPFPPGGSVDMLARLVQPSLQERLGQPIVVENRAGASGSIGAAAAAGAPPDGHTWLFVFDTQAVNPSLMPDLPFDSRADLDPVMLIGTAPNVLATQPDSPYQTFEDVLEAARADPEGVSYGSIGTGSLGHLTMVLLAEQAGVELLHVPYSGGGPAIQDAVAGHVDLVIGSAALVSPQLEAENLRAILQTGAERHPMLPDVPTAVEAGFDGFESIAWWGVFVPAGTPQAIVERFHADLTAVLRQEEISQRLTELQRMELVLSGAEEFEEFFEREMEIWGAVVREHNIVGGS